VAPWKLSTPPPHGVGETTRWFLLSRNFVPVSRTTFTLFLMGIKTSVQLRIAKRCLPLWKAALPMKAAELRLYRVRGTSTAVQGLAMASRTVVITGRAYWQEAVGVHGARRSTRLSHADPAVCNPWEQSQEQVRDDGTYRAFRHMRS
jgi:hypothetical protein